MRFGQLVGRSVLVWLLLGALLACGAPPGPSIRVEDVWARPAQAMEEAGQGTAEAASQGMGMTGTGAVFMRVINDGQGPDRLVGGETDVARVVEIHETVMEGDVTTMQMLANGLEIPAKSEVLLKPGSFHVMLIGMQRDLAVGDRFNITLQFEESGEMDLAVQVQEP